MLYITLKDPKIASKIVQLGGDINVNYPYKFLSPQKTIFLKLTPFPPKKNPKFEILLLFQNYK